MEEELVRELKNVETVKSVIAHLYLYPSYAVVELGNKLYDLVAKSKSVTQGSEPNTIIIDGKTYGVYIEEDVSFTYWEDLEECEEGVEEAIREECERLEEKFRSLENKELVALLENSNSDFYVFALISLAEED